MTSFTPRSLKLPYQYEDFPAGSKANSPSDLNVTWDELLWAAVTVGRPPRNYVFSKGDISPFEALFRWSLTRMALEQTSPKAYRLQRTNAAKTLDPAEKGAVNYFLGMTFCKLFAAKLLDTPWVLHLDVFSEDLNAVLTSRSRPDLIGKENGTGNWHAFECKGRISPPDKTVKKKAKDQAQRLVSVNGVPCSLHIGAITYFKNDTLQFYWRDPEPERKNPIKLSFTRDTWRYYYEPVVRLIARNRDFQTRMQRESGVFLPIADLDIEVGIHPLVAKLLFHDQWERAHLTAMGETRAIAEAGYQGDGIAVKSGDSWCRSFVDAKFTE